MQSEIWTMVARKTRRPSPIQTNWLHRHPFPFCDWNRLNFRLSFVVANTSLVLCKTFMFHHHYHRVESVGRWIRRTLDQIANVVFNPFAPGQTEVVSVTSQIKKQQQTTTQRQTEEHHKATVETTIREISADYCSWIECVLRLALKRNWIRL